MSTSHGSSKAPDKETRQRPKAAKGETGGRVDIHIPAKTYIGLFAAILLGWLAYLMWPLLLLVFLAVFLAVTLHALVTWLDKRGMPHSLSLGLVIGGVLSLVGLTLWVVLPIVADQIAHIGPTLEKLRAATLEKLPPGSGLRQVADGLLAGMKAGDAGVWMANCLAAAKVVLEACSQVFIWLAISIYLLVDGLKIYEWALAFFKADERRKLRETGSEISHVIFHYVFGQGVTSAFVFVVSFITLTTMQVPGALMVSLLAGVLDILPVLGFVMSIVPALLLAMTVSSQAAVVVAIVYVTTHAVENYFLIPHVYGKTLRVSTLTVLLGLLVGGTLAGIQGAIAILPIIASYAVVERIWLEPYMNRGVVEKHEEQKDREFGTAG